MTTTCFLQWPSNPGLRFADPSCPDQPVQARCRPHPSWSCGHSMCLHEDMSSITSRFRQPSQTVFVGERVRTLPAGASMPDVCSRREQTRLLLY